MVLVALTMSSTAVAQSDRGGIWEFGLMLNHSDSESLSAAEGSSLDIDSSRGYGLNLAYNFNSRLAIGGEFNWSTPDYRAVIVPGYGYDQDPAAVETFQRIFPEREVVQVSIGNIALGGGGVHCITQQQPASRQRTGIGLTG